MPERPMNNARTHWMWLVAVKLLGIAGGSAACISEPVRVSPDRLRFGARVFSRRTSVARFPPAD
jgi:hypothetical protein